MLAETLDIYINECGDFNSFSRHQGGRKFQGNANGPSNVSSSFKEINSNEVVETNISMSPTKTSSRNYASNIPSSRDSNTLHIIFVDSLSPNIVL